MKKIFYFLSVAVLALSISSCNNKNNDPTMELSVVYDAAENGPAVTVTLSDEGTPFLLVPFKTNVLGKAKEADIFAAIVEVYGSRMVELAHDKSGVYYFRENVWEPGEQYTIIGFMFNVETLTQVGKMASAEVEIPTKSSNVLNLSYDPYSDKETVYVKTTNDAPYYITIIPDSIYAKYIESGSTTVAQYVSLALKEDMQMSKNYNPNRTYKEIFELYTYEGDEDFNFVEEYESDFLKGTYHALAAGVELVETVADFNILPTTKGYETVVELTEDLILPADKRAQLQAKKGQFRVIRNSDLQIDLIKLHTSTMK